MTEEFALPDSGSGGKLLVWVKAHRARLFRWLRLVIAVGLIVFVVVLVAQDRHKFTAVDWKLVPLAWLLMVISTCVKALRWGLLVRRSELDVGYRRLLGTYMVGSFFSTVLPTSVGGDAVRAVDTAAKTGRAADVASSVLIERGVGLLVVIGSGSLFALFLESGKVPVVFLWLVHALFITGLVGMIMLRLGLFIEPVVRILTGLRLGKVADKVQQLQEAFNDHLSSPVVLGQMVGLSMVANTLTMAATYIVLTAVTDPVKIGAFVPMIALATAAELIPISPAALGVKESAYVFFLGLIGVTSVSAGVLAIIMRILTWAHALLGGLVFMSRTLRGTEEEKAAFAQVAFDKTALGQALNMRSTFESDAIPAEAAADVETVEVVEPVP